MEIYDLKFSNCHNATDTVGVTGKRKHETIYEMPSGFDSTTQIRLSGNEEEEG